MISVGFRLSRPMAAIVVGVLGFVLAAYGSGQYTALYQNYLFVLSYWIAPWIGILLTHWYLNGQQVPQRYSLGWTKAATVFVIVTVITIFLFASTTVYTGVVATWLGGVDIGYFAGFILAAVLYASLCHRSNRSAATVDRSKGRP